MKEEITKHKWAYTILITGVLIFIFVFLGAWPNRWIQRLVVLALACYYFLWGVLTHLKTKTITKSVLWEYGMVAGLGALLLLLITV